MMSETVVTVQDGAPNNANNPRQPGAVKSEPGQPAVFAGITLNVPYFRSIPGMAKIAQLILGIICILCASPPYNAGNSWFLFVATTSFIASILWTFIYLLSIREAFRVPINWILTELLNTGIWAVLYTIAFIVEIFVASLGSYPAHGRSSYLIAGIFGIVNTLAYAAGSYFLWLEWKNNSNQ